ncbi:hypothetical protein [Aquabacterium sp.]|uniref:hypothetical protein n=1 Tax=Aquabacterium sp. TaxID=1872578 RepID=UPI0037851346
MKVTAAAVLVVSIVASSVAIAGRRGGDSHGAHSGSHKSNPGGAHHVAGHSNKKGQYVHGHRQTNPNGSKRDNWSSKSNTNPDTGKKGTKDPDKP